MAPAATQCVYRHDLVVEVPARKKVIYRRIAVFVDGRLVRLVRGLHASARLELGGLPSGTFTVKMTARTGRGRRLVGARTYMACPV